jgi:Icc-related predicted phosphoesterase
MASQRVSRILCVADPRGGERLRAAIEAAQARDVHAVAVVGDLSDGTDHRSALRALGDCGLPAYWVPGPGDAPISDYLREAYNMETVFPLLHGVHGTAAFAPDGHLLFAGLGGEVDDDPDSQREETERLRYPRWEAEYRLKLLRELDEHAVALLFAAAPLHKGQGTGSSEALAELVGTYRPRLVVCGGERGHSMIGRSIVVAPGSLGDGHYAVVDLQTREVELEELATAQARG